MKKLIAKADQFELPRKSKRLKLEQGPGNGGDQNDDSNAWENQGGLVTGGTQQGNDGGAGSGSEFGVGSSSGGDLATGDGSDSGSDSGEQPPVTDDAPGTETGGDQDQGAEDSLPPTDPKPGLGDNGANEEKPGDANKGEGQPGNAEVTVYRLYNRYDGSHLITTDQNEYESLPVASNGGWVKEGARYTLPATSPVPIHRLYNPNNGDHLYSTSASEVAALTAQTGWVDEGVKFYGAKGDATVPIYRLWNSYQTANGGLGSHLWTESASEYQTLPGYSEGGWQQEGEAWRALRVISR